MFDSWDETIQTGLTLKRSGQNLGQSRFTLVGNYSGYRPCSDRSLAIELTDKDIFPPVHERRVVRISPCPGWWGYIVLSPHLTDLS